MEVVALCPRVPLSQIDGSVCGSKPACGGTVSLPLSFALWGAGDSQRVLKGSWCQAWKAPRELTLIADGFWWRNVVGLHKTKGCATLLACATRLKTAPGVDWFPVCRYPIKWAV